MAQKKKQSVKKPAKSKSAPKLVRTKFMAAFSSQFIGSKAITPWPAPGGQSNPSMVADFLTFMGVLSSAEITLTPPTGGNSDSVADRLGNFLIAQKWPANTPIPKQWQGIQSTVRLIEISVIADRLLKAINSSPGRGGPGSGWPPH